MDQEKYSRIVREGYENYYRARLKDANFEKKYRQQHNYSALQTDRIIFMEIFVEFLKNISKGSRFLDAGCGVGNEVCKYLVEHGYKVIGIDISESAIKLAKQNVPSARFFVMDMASMDEFLSESFDVVFSRFAIIHVKRELHRKVYDNFYRILASGGKILLSVAPTSGQYVGNYFGNEVLWSHWDAKTEQRLLEEAGFRVHYNKSFDMGPDEIHNWIYAEKS
jgi:SAM-dependent methyltransferase